MGRLLRGFHGLFLGHGDLFADVLVFAIFRSAAQVVNDEADESAKHGNVAEPLDGTLPELNHQRDVRIFRQAAVEFGFGGVMQDVHHAGAADARGVVDAGVGKIVVVAELRGALFGEVFHVFFAAEMQTAGRASFDAGGLEAFANTVGAQRALVNALGLRIELGNVEGAAGDAVPATDAVGLLEVHYAVGVLDDGAVGRAGGQAAGVGTMHALILAHEPLQGA